MGERTYKVTSPIRFKGSNYGIGATVTMTPEEARQFGDCLELCDGSPDDDGYGPESAQVELLTEKIKELQGQLTTLQGENTALQTTIDKLNGQLANRESDLDEMNTELIGLKTDKENLLTELDGVKNLLVAAQDNEKKLTAEVEQLKAGQSKKK